MTPAGALATVWLSVGGAVAGAAEPIAVHAAGSLRAPLTRIAQDFEDTGGGAKLTLTFGASGLLRDRLLAGERSDVFASANMEHPQALVAAGKAARVQPFARNTLCALSTPEFSLQGKTLAQRLLDADVKIGTSTPKADPSGDYAFEMFDRIESTGAAPPGSAALLKAKALQLTGGPTSPPPPADRNVYAMQVSERHADVFITYCSNAALAALQAPTLRVLTIPPAINVSVLYGVAVVGSSAASAGRFVDFLLSPAGQERLASFGFTSP